MVRGPAALLAVVGVALAYVLVAPELPQLHPPELSALVACTIGLTLVVAIVAGLAALADAPLALFPAVLGAGLLVAALDANDVGAAATPFEVVLLGCLGIAFAVIFDVPALAVALPLFLAAIDIVQASEAASAGLFTLSTSKPRRRAHARAARLGDRARGRPAERHRRSLPRRLRGLRAAPGAARARGRGRACSWAF